MCSNADDIKSEEELPSPEEEIAALEEEMAGLVKERDHAMAEVKRLMSEEDIKNGKSFAQEIFDTQQDKLRLDVEIEFRRRKINRIRVGERDRKDYERLHNK